MMTTTPKTSPPIARFFAWGAALFALIVTGNLAAQQLLRPSSVTAAQAHKQISLGEELLINTVVTKDKQAGIAAFEKADFLGAIQHFQTSLLQQPNDPETLIYLNNARSQRSDDDILRIAVSVPAGNNPAIAQEMLRGVAQAQDAINSLGINGARLEVMIVDDENSKIQAQALAPKVIADPQILAVVGSNASDPSLMAASMYQPAGLTMISPTSFSSKLSDFGSYTFRTIPQMNSLAKALASHAVQTAGKTKMGLCYDSNAVDNVSFKEDFVVAYQSLGGTLVDIPCDMSQGPIQKPVIQQLLKQTDALMIAPNIDRQEDAIALIEATQGKLALFSTPTLYTSTILDESRRGIEGMVLAAPWYAERYSATSFLAKAEQRWGADAITWRTATSFDATVAIAQALGNIPPHDSVNRNSLQAQLRSPDFSATGAGESIQFLPSGDRAGRAILVTVQRKGGTRRFVAVAPKAAAVLEATNR